MQVNQSRQCDTYGANLNPIIVSIIHSKGGTLPAQSSYCSKDLATSSWFCLQGTSLLTKRFRTDFTVPKYPAVQTGPWYAVAKSFQNSFTDPKETTINSAGLFKITSTWLPVPFWTGHCWEKCGPLHVFSNFSFWLGIFQICFIKTVAVLGPQILAEVL